MDDISPLKGAWSGSGDSF